jgi:hypothetical protein
MPLQVDASIADLDPAVRDNTSQFWPAAILRTAEYHGPDGIQRPGGREPGLKNIRPH